MKNITCCEGGSKKLRWLNALFVTGFLVVLMTSSFGVLADSKSRTLRDFLVSDNAPNCVKLTNATSEYSADDWAGSIGSVCIVPGEGAMVNQTYYSDKKLSEPAPQPSGYWILLVAFVVYYCFFRPLRRK